MKRAVIVVALFLALLLGACSSTVASAEQTNPIKIWFQNENGAYETLQVVDENTGVNYVVVATEVGNGHRSIAITPRLNADGTLYVTGGGNSEQE